MDLGADTPDFEDAPCPSTCFPLERDVLKAATSLTTVDAVFRRFLSLSILSGGLSHPECFINSWIDEAWLEAIVATITYLITILTRHSMNVSEL